jgi:hypothetical protein
MQAHEQKVEIPAVDTLAATAHHTPGTVVFKDLAGREWSCAITVATVKRVLERLKIDLMDVFKKGSQLQARLFSEPILLCDVLYTVLEPQAKSMGVTELQFAEAMGGDAMDGAVEALITGLHRFPRLPEIRAALQKVYQAHRAMEDRAARSINRQLESPAMQERMEATSRELDRRIEEAMKTPPLASGGRSTDAPASLESTPAPSASES